MIGAGGRRDLTTGQRVLGYSERVKLMLFAFLHYIEQQLEHHRRRTFQEEYLAFLEKHGAHFDEKYLWD